MKKVSYTFMLMVLFFASSGQKVSFYRENITMEIRGQQFYVSGTYYFHYNASEKKLLYYPFPTGEQYGKPDSIFLFDLTNAEVIEPLKQDSSGLTFLVDFSDHQDISVQISYKQALLGNEAEYILETTKIWGKAFEEASYQLIIPSTLTILRFAIPPDDTIITYQEKIYTWHKFHYMPEDNMIFEFEKK